MSTIESDDERFLTRREAEILISQNAAAIGLAMTVAQQQQHAHNTAHESAHVAHAEKHTSENVAVNTALTAVAKERSIHAEAHERDHAGHQREHGLNNLAIDKAEQANDKRFTATNGYREQIDAVVRTLASKDALDAIEKELDRRFEDMRTAISILERTDVKAEGRGIGQGSMVAYIVTAVGLVGSILAIVIVIANVLTT